MKRIKEAVKEYYGKRCPDFEPECVVCQAWAEFYEAKRVLNQKRFVRKYYHELTEQQKIKLIKLLMWKWGV
jgi:hypothetical protein